MAAAAILKNRKIAICPPRFDRFWPNLARRHTSTLLSCRTVKSLKFEKIQDGGGRHLEKSKNRHISANHKWENHISISPSYPGQLSLLPSVEREMSTSQSAVMLCGWGVKGGMTHSTCLCTTRWKAKLCHPSLTRAIPDCLRDEKCNVTVTNLRLARSAFT